MARTYRNTGYKKRTHVSLKPHNRGDIKISIYDVQ